MQKLQIKVRDLTAIHTKHNFLVGEVRKAVLRPDYGRIMCAIPIKHPFMHPVLSLRNIKIAGYKSRK